MVNYVMPALETVDSCILAGMVFTDFTKNHLDEIDESVGDVDGDGGGQDAVRFFGPRSARALISKWKQKQRLCLRVCVFACCAHCGIVVCALALVGSRGQESPSAASTVNGFLSPRKHRPA